MVPRGSARQIAALRFREGEADLKSGALQFCNGESKCMCKNAALRCREGEANQESGNLRFREGEANQKMKSGFLRFRKAKLNKSRLVAPRGRSSRANQNRRPAVPKGQR
jgi:hypothetical protein